VNTLRAYQLRFDGERYIAGELVPLPTKGYRVYHDFVFGMKAGDDKTAFNIDHISIGSSGVFAIETKAHRKSIGVSCNG